MAQLKKPFALILRFVLISRQVQEFANLLVRIIFKMIVHADKQILQFVLLIIFA